MVLWIDGIHVKVFRLFVRKHIIYSLDRWGGQQAGSREKIHNQVFSGSRLCYLIGKLFYTISRRVEGSFGLHLICYQFCQKILFVQDIVNLQRISGTIYSLYSNKMSVLK